MRYALLVLEQPWSSISANPRQPTVRPFLEGLAALNKMPIYYATYFDGHSFDQALQYLLDAQQLKSVDKVILYIAGHGAGTRLGGEFGRAMNLGPLFRRLEKYGRRKIAGVLLDSCQLGMNEHLIPKAMKKIRLSWLVAYGASMDWMSSMLINLNLLQHLCQIPTADLEDEDELTTAIQAGLDLFNPGHVVESLDDEEVDLAALEDFLEEMEADEFPAEDEGDDEVSEIEDDGELAGEDDESLELNLSEGLTIALRYRRNNGRFRTEILSAERRWPMLEDLNEDEEGEEA